ncbi:MAG: DNA gyrase inhibitor YacG [Sphingomonas sp.]
MSTPNPPRRSACPLCGRPVVASAHAPFCSKGCRDRDLLQWLGDGYRLPGRAITEDEENARDGLDSER